jgi:hypothetical protein
MSVVVLERHVFASLKEMVRRLEAELRAANALIERHEAANEAQLRGALALRDQLRESTSECARLMQESGA